jgi:hypothetical protein
MVLRSRPYRVAALPTRAAPRPGACIAVSPSGHERGSLQNRPAPPPPREAPRRPLPLPSRHHAGLHPCHRDPQLSLRRQKLRGTLQKGRPTSAAHAQIVDMNNSHDEELKKWRELCRKLENLRSHLYGYSRPRFSGASRRTRCPRRVSYGLDSRGLRWHWHDR